MERVAADGFVAAAFRHRTSRAGDPLLHTHVLVANLARAVDDRVWRTLDATALYTHAKTAGYLYQAALRHELTARLGVQWAPIRNGCADLAGVPDTLIEAFSQRRIEILAELDRRGESSAAAAQAATLATRKAKTYGVDPASLTDRWHDQAAALGVTPAELKRLLGRTTAVTTDRAALDTVAADLASPAGLTARASTFTRRDVVQAWCAHLPDGAPIEQIEALADHWLENPGAAVRLLQPATADRGSVVRRCDGRVVTTGDDEARYSTVELLATEQQLVAGAAARRHDHVAIARPHAVEAAIARRPTLTPEQQTLIRRLTGSGTGVEVVVGKAGAGKTYGLAAARDAWQASGVRVIGCALSAQARDQLQAGAGIPSWTIDALLADLDRPDAGGLPAGGVVVIDEAAMVGTRTLGRLLAHAKDHSAKVVLVGDHHQLPEIDAGGAYRGLAHRLDPIELTDNRRQTHAWERAALDQLRDGDPATAVAGYHAAGRVVVADAADAARDRLVDDWWHARQEHGPGAGIMLAARVADVDDLNRRARDHLTAAGHLHGPTLDAAGRIFQAGDHIVCGHNDRRVGVINGSRGTVTATHPDRCELDIALADGRSVTLPAAYLDAGHVRHGYAITGHKAQGATTDRTWVLASDATYREWGYVALSRGRHDNRLYLVADPDPVDDAHTHTGAEPHREPLQGLTATLTRSHAQHLASDTTDRTDSGPADARRLAALRSRRDQATARVTDLREHLQAPTTSAPPRRLLRQRAPASDSRERRAGDLRAWQQRVADLDAQLSRLTAPDLSSLGAQSPRLEERLPATVAHTATRAAQAAQLKPPAYLLAAIGPRPSDAIGRQPWQRAALAVERYRAAHNVTDPTSALGVRPREPHARQAHDAAALAVLGARPPQHTTRDLESQPIREVAHV